MAAVIPAIFRNLRLWTSIGSDALMVTPLACSIYPQNAMHNHHFLGRAAALPGQKPAIEASSHVPVRCGRVAVERGVTAPKKDSSY